MCRPFAALAGFQQWLSRTRGLLAGLPY